MHFYSPMLTAVAREQSVIEGGMMIAFECQRGLPLSICFGIASCNVFVVPYNKSLNDRSLGKQLILFPENLNVSRETK